MRVIKLNAEIYKMVILRLKETMLFGLSCQKFGFMCFKKEQEVFKECNNNKTTAKRWFDICRVGTGRKHFCNLYQLKDMFLCWDV